MAQDLLDDSSSSESEASGASIGDTELKINTDFAKRFEHNKKREELQRLEEKHGKESRKRKREAEDASESVTSDEESSSDSEDEDDAGELATAALDSEIMATLNAIRSKDPRVYDPKSTFYKTSDENEPPRKDKAEKPMYLRDYHRENLLSGVKPDEEEQPLSYNQEQEQLKKSIIDEMYAAAEDSEGDEDDWLVAKKREKPVPAEVTLDIENADKDPEAFLSKFIASRAWVPSDKSTWQPLESDDEEEERRADEFEEAYNFRFEDPNKSNETLRTHARDMAAKYSVRREEKNARQKKRDAKKEQKELEKQQRKEEKARLRKLRIEEVEEKVKKIKHTAGLRTADLRPEDWANFVDEDWDDTKWEEEMQKRFGEEYYAEDDVISEYEEGATTKKRKPKKPKFDDDIDINDIVPDFDNEEDAHFSLSDEDKAASKKKDHKKLKEEKRRESKKERRIIEQLVDDQLQLELQNSLPGGSKAAGFLYRETSPQSFGLSARDILLAEDSQLNQFAGLKKLASFRDPEKKAKDRKHLGKKARLRKWRQETFGDGEGLQNKDLVPSKDDVDAGKDEAEEGGVNIREHGKKKRRRSKKQKTGAETLA